jgi:hypothetical protein
VSVEVVVAAVECIRFSDTGVAAEEVGERSGVEPVAVEAPFGAGGDEAVEHEDAEDFFPVGAFAGGFEAGSKKCIQF